MNENSIISVLEILQKQAPSWNAPVLTEMAAFGSSPYEVLVACLLSLRTKDTTTAPAAHRLFALAKTPQDMVNLETQQIEQTIYPVGFYRNKAKIIKDISQVLIERYQGKVPHDLDELLTLHGVGRKTANLVVSLGYHLPGICVDTHVHRISNRFGYVQTKTPDETEMKLREKLPQKYWKEYNDLLVALGQTICHPTSPKCSQCPVLSFCHQVGVVRKR